MLADGRRILVQNAPYFASLIYRTQIVPDSRIPTMGVTESMILAYSPAFVEKYNARQVAALLWHEMMHLATTMSLRHVVMPAHRGNLLNIASDLFINDRGRREGWDLPREGLFPEKYGFPAGLGTLDYLELLLQDQQQQQKQSESGGGEGAGEGRGSVCSGHCGIDSPLKEELEKQHGASSGGDDLKEALREVAQAAERMQSKSAGSVPASLVTLLPQLMPPQRQLSWDDLLRNSLRSTASSVRGAYDLTYARPHKKAFVRDEEVVQPGSFGFIPEVTVIVDTSGSMDEDLLKKCLGVIAGMLDELSVDDVELATADTEIQSRKKVSRYSLVNNFKLEGGGGTDFAEPLREIARPEPPGMVVYLTDGYGSFGPPPKFPVLWVIFTDVVAPYGTTIHIPPPQL